MSASTAGDSYIQLKSAIEQSGADQLADQEPVKIWLETLAEHSRSLTQACIANPQVLLSLIEEGGIERRRRKRALIASRNKWAAAVEESELSLRRFHRSEMVRIALRDLLGVADIQVITEELSLLADLVMSETYDAILSRLVETYGQPVCSESGEHSGMCVIGMGKQGGKELNFSSDIDVMFAYDDDGRTEGGAEEPIENRAFFTRLAQEFCDFLSKPTKEGFFYRIDTRLRPEGGSGMLATPLMAIEIYYHSYGQNWERQALLKARPVAGAEPTGERFMRLITPFTYRRYIDELEIAEVLRDIDRLRNQAMNEIGVDKHVVNFKQGLGGIRDVEFFVQAVQMLYGRQYPEIRLAGTLVSLQRMYESHLLQSNDYEALSEAYRFLRRVEHRLQMVNEMQVYELPAVEADRARLARAMGFEEWEAFFNSYQALTRRTRAIYTGVFHRDEWRDATELLIESTRFDEEIESVLEAYEFENPRQAFTLLKELQKANEPHLQSKTTRLFRSILPRLLSELKESPDSDMALANFEKLVGYFHARTSLYDLMNSERALFKVLVSVVSGSMFLTRLVQRDPSLIETMGSEELVDAPIRISTLARHLELIASAYPKESGRDHLLRVQNAAMFRSGIRFILGLTDVEQTGSDLAEIADFVLLRSFEPVYEQMSERYPVFTENGKERIAVLGYGKLGGRDFNVASDCDVVFVHLDIAVEGETTTSEYHQRWAVKYLNYLETQANLGFLYKPDARLRPNGKNSPMSCSWDSFEEYYRNSAQLWEKMALSRSRMVGGPPEIANRLELLKSELLYSHPLSADELDDILAMRTKIETEKRGEALKAGPGGLVDVEFIAQTIALHFGHRYEELRSPATLKVLRAARRCGLLSDDSASRLIESYLFLREVENRLRIVNNLSLDSIPDDRHELESLTRRYGLRLDQDAPDPDRFLRWINDRTCGVRNIFTEFFNSLKSSLGNE